MIENLLGQFSKLETQTKIDELTDAMIEVSTIRNFIDSLGIRLPEEEYNAIIHMLDPQDDGVVRITKFVDRLEGYLIHLTRKDEFLEAFRVFDTASSGVISVSKFRLILKKHMNLENELMDELIMDMLEMKKIAPIDPSTNLDYVKFAERMFDSA